MKRRYWHLLIFGVGLALLAFPIYYTNFNRFPVIDSMSFNLGLVPSGNGGFYSLIGVMYLMASGIAVITQNRERWSQRELFSIGIIAISALWSGFVIMWITLGMRIKLPMIAILIASFPVIGSFIWGLNNEISRRIPVVAFGLTILPFFIWILIGPGSPLGKVIVFLLGIGLIVLNITFSYPLYKYGEKLTITISNA